MDALAVILEQPEKLALRRLPLTDAAVGDAVVDVAWSGISTGTERLLWSGRMPSFPGMGYPLVPGYETVGQVAEAPAGASVRAGQWVFVPGARCFGTVRGLFGGAASRLVTPAESSCRSMALWGAGVPPGLAATAHRAARGIAEGERPLIVGHGVLGRLLARVAVAMGAEPTVWETDETRRDTDGTYGCVSPEADSRRDYARILDVSGDSAGLDGLVARLAPGGEIVLAGFYEAPLSFAFPPAFMREARLRISAEFRPDDLAAVTRLIEGGRLSLDGLITHRAPAARAEEAYRTAFADPACLKMVLDWRDAA